MHEFELIRFLARVHDIHVVQSRGGSPLPTDALLGTGARYTEVEWTAHPYPTTKLGIAGSLIRAKPNLVHWLCRDRIPRLADAIATIGEEEHPDLVHITHGELAGVLDHVRVPTALLLFDVLTRVFETRLAVESLARRRVQLRIECRRTRAFERQQYRKASGVAAVSSVDAAWLGPLLDRSIEVIENPIGDEFFEPPNVTRSPTTVTFAGALSHAPNADAITWLVRDIWPQVLARRPDAELQVVGRGDDDATVARELRRLVEAGGGRVDQDVPDIRPFYWTAAAVVAPLRHGAGLRNKVLHAMACGAPLVATPAAIDGLPADAASCVRVGTTAAEIADAVIEVLDDTARAQQRATQAVDGLRALRSEAVAAQHDRWWARCVER